MWLTAILASLLLIPLKYVYPEGGSVFLEVLGALLTTACVLPLLLSTLVTGSRTMKVIERKAPWLLPTLGGGIFLVAIIGITVEARMGGELIKGFGIVIGAIFSIMVIGIVLIITLPFLAGLLPYRWMDGAEGSFWTTVSFFRAKKEKVCPLVNPPEGFKPPESFKE